MIEKLVAMEKEVEQLKGQRNALVELLQDNEAALKVLKVDFLDAEEGQKIAQTVAKATQQKLKLLLEPIVTSALEAVWGNDAYGFDVDFQVKNNKTSCKLAFTRGGNAFSPLESTGYGPVDVAAFALRLASWNISKPQTRPTFVLDEPMKHVSEDMQEKVMKMISILSHKLGIQVIMVTHTKESDVMEYSDKVFVVSKPKKYSKVKVVKG